MEFSAWRKHFSIPLTWIAEITNLPISVLEQVDQGSCASLQVARRLRMKLYQSYRHPEILTWKFFAEDEEGLPLWWWRVTWEDPIGVRICVLIPTRSQLDATDLHWKWILRRHVFAPAPGHHLLDELGELPTTDPDLFQKPSENLSDARSEERSHWWRCSWEEANGMRVFLQIPGERLQDAQDLYQRWASQRRLPLLADTCIEALGMLPDADPALYPKQPANALPYPTFDDDL